jgi:DNA adenine methylase
MNTLAGKTYRHFKPSFPQTPLPPIVKWVGGKRWQVTTVGPMFRLMNMVAGKRYRFIELFAGGAAMSFGLLPRRALLNDSLPPLMDFYRFISRYPHRWEWPKIGWENNADQYYENRQMFNEAADPDVRSALFYYLNRHCYNGLWRQNRKGEFNVPFGKYAKVKLDTTFMDYSTALKHWTLRCGDYKAVKLDRDDFVYADPPYDTEFRNYTGQPFEFEDQIELAERLAAHTGPVVLCNAPTGRILELYKQLGFEISIVPRSSTIGCKSRKKVYEVIATNFQRKEQQ